MVYKELAEHSIHETEEDLYAAPDPRKEREKKRGKDKSENETEGTEKPKPYLPTSHADSS